MKIINGLDAFLTRNWWHNHGFFTNYNCMRKRSYRTNL